MKNPSSKEIAKAIVLAALNELKFLSDEYKDKDILELMLAISAIGGAFEDGWLEELMQPIEAMVSAKRPDLATQIKIRRKRKKAGL